MAWGENVNLGDWTVKINGAFLQSAWQYALHSPIHTHCNCTMNTRQRNRSNTEMIKWVTFKCNKFQGVGLCSISIKYIYTYRFPVLFEDKPNTGNSVCGTCVTWPTTLTIKKKKKDHQRQNGTFTSLPQNLYSPIVTYTYELGTLPFTSAILRNDAATWQPFKNHVFNLTA